MPKLSAMMDNRSQSNSIRANVRYCDSQNSRHYSGINSCSYVSPLISGLVPEEQRHRRLRNGVDSSHYSFSAIQSASLLLRLNKRFESIDTDRQESVVDVLNDIANKLKDSTSLLQRVCTQVDSEGTVCTLLKQICDAFRASLISESPQMEAVARNTSYIMDYSAEQINQTKALKSDLNTYCSDQMMLLDKGLEYMRHSVNNGNEMIDKLSCIADLCANSGSETKQMIDRIDKNTTEMSSIKYEIQMLGTIEERMDANIQMSGMEVKQELVEMKHEISQIKEEIRSMRDAIIDILPNKLLEVFNGMALDQSSELDSDTELIQLESQKLDELVVIGNQSQETKD